MDFKPIAELSKKAKIQMNINTTDDVMEVLMFITLKEVDKQSAFNLEPLVFNGTPEELENELPQMVNLLMTNNKNVLHQIERISKALRKEETKVTKKAGGKKATTTKKEETKEPSNQVDIFSAEAQVPKQEQNKETKKEEVSLPKTVAEVEQKQKEEVKSSNSDKPVASYSEYKEKQHAENIVKRINRLSALGFKLEGDVYKRQGVSMTKTMVETLEDEPFELSFSGLEAQIKAQIEEAPEPPFPTNLSPEPIKEYFDSIIQKAKENGINTDKIKFEDYSTKEQLDVLNNKTDKLISTLTL